jgi:hypothetical protein
MNIIVCKGKRGTSYCDATEAKLHAAALEILADRADPTQIGCIYGPDLPTLPMC